MTSEGKYWDKAWSLVEGCSPVSVACDNCWLAGMDDRFKGGLTSGGRFTGKVYIRPDRLELPMKVKRPTVWAVWSDLFHESVPAEFIKRAFEVMEYCRQHTFIVCTKRPERIQSVLYGPEGNYFLGGGDYIPNVILMITAENQDMADARIPELINNWPFKLAVLVEPMLGPINLGLIGTVPKTEGCGYRPLADLISWVVLGCESGPKRRPMDIEWARDVVRQYRAAGVPVFVKQLDINGRVGRRMEEWPEDLRVRELPWKGGEAK